LVRDIVGLYAGRWKYWTTSCRRSRKKTELIRENRTDELDA
jgi:hypothetical protein